MSTTKLSDIATIHSGGRLGFSGNDFVAVGVPAYGAAGLNGYLNEAEYEFKDAVILSSIGARCGKAFLVSGEWTSLANTQVIIPNPMEADSRFLWYQLNDESRWPRSGSAQPFIKPSDVKSHQVWIPALDEQRRIAGILDCADALRTKCRQVLAHLETLTQSIFREMFGTERGVIHALSEVADFFSGASLPEGETFTGQDGGTLLMKVSDMNRIGNEDQIVSTGLWTQGLAARPATVGAGAVVLPKRGASIATNKKRLTTRRTALDPNLMGIQPRIEVLTSRYLHEWFKAFDLATITSGSTVPQLNKQDLAPLKFPLPPIEQQNAFMKRIARVDVQKEGVQRAAEACDHLFDSLQYRAFRGKL